MHIILHTTFQISKILYIQLPDEEEKKSIITEFDKLGANTYFQYFERRLETSGGG